MPFRKDQQMNMVQLRLKTRVIPFSGFFALIIRERPALRATGGDQSPPTAKGKEKEDLLCKIR